MKKIYLTINISVTDNCFDNLVNFKKLNFGELIKHKKLILQPFELEIIRGKIVAEAILGNEDDLLIGRAIQNSQDLKTIFEAIENRKECISKIFFDNGRSRKAAIEEYKKKYSLHARWLDYSPDYVEQAYIDFDKKIEEIKSYAIEKEVELVAI